MFELLYTSVAPRGLSEPDLKLILARARVKNKRLNVTGMLVYHNREIMQILEGDKATVLDLFQSIFDDDRHVSVNVFYQGDIESRAFSDWSMAFQALDYKTIQTMEKSYEAFNEAMPPIAAIAGIPNRGKEAFLSLRKSL